MKAAPAYRRFVDTVGPSIVMIERGLPFNRRLSRLERQCLAVAAAQPTHLLTLNSAEFGYSDIGPAWARLRKRLLRRDVRCVVYVAVQAHSNGDAGYHLHVLLWNFVPIWTLRRMAEAVGFGPPDIQRINQSAEDKLWSSIYVFGQAEPVFGSWYHLRHRHREKWAHRFSRTSNKVLEKANPQLLSAIKMAEDRSVSDQELVKLVPRFINTNKGS